jgi:hypothetical protein
MTTTATPSHQFANQLSRYLRTQGVAVRYSGASRSAEGVRVERSVFDGTAVVFVDYDQTSHEQRVAAAIAEILTAAGYAVEPNPHTASILTVRVAS